MAGGSQDSLWAGYCGDFLRLLDRSGDLPAFLRGGASGASVAPHTEGTTVIAVKYRDGVINVGDRRATAENFVLYDRADKILPLDDYTLIAVSGSYARAMEAVRLLRHSFEYYRRSQLQEISLEGKLSEVTRLLAASAAESSGPQAVMLPLLSAYDRQRGEGRLFFYDALGARFESAEFGAAGSGSHRIRGAFDYIVKTKGPFHQMTFNQALREALVLLDIAAELDAATGGLEKVPPTVKAVCAEGIRELSEDEVLKHVRKLKGGS